LYESFWYLNKQTNKIDMKTKLLALVATLGMVASASAVKINNNLSINGFIDGSYNLSDGATDTQSVGIDEVELNFNVNVGGVSGLVAIDNTQDEGVNVEQAHITYSLNDSVSLTFGRYGSALGFEREDPAGLYTVSRAYDSNTFNLGDVDANQVEGLTIAYTTDSLTVAASIEESVARSSDLEANDLNLEISFTYTGIAGVNIGGGYFFDNQDGANAETDVLNLHVSRQFGKLLLAGEYIETQNDAADQDAYLLLADYDFSDKLGVAVRFSNNEQGNDADYEKFTIAPNYAITESLGAILEYSDVDDNEVDSEVYSVELTYTF